MKLISLNAWGGRSLYPLMRFFKHKAADTDVFCLQEVFQADQAILDRKYPEEHVRGDLFAKIGAALKDFEGFFAYFDSDPNHQSLAMFIKKTVPLKEASDLLVYRSDKAGETGGRVTHSSRKLQYAKIRVGKTGHIIVHFHGLWDAGPKTDNKDRLVQARNIKKFLAETPGPKILCGDFNLLPDTESIKILEEGMRNLVRESGVQSTRTVLYRHYENPEEPNFADYILVSPDIEVRRFEVLPDIVSDHSPLFLEFGSAKK